MKEMLFQLVQMRYNLSIIISFKICFRFMTVLIFFSVQDLFLINTFSKKALPVADIAWYPCHYNDFSCQIIFSLFSFDWICTYL